MKFFNARAVLFLIRFSGEIGFPGVEEHNGKCFEATGLTYGHFLINDKH